MNKNLLTALINRGVVNSKTLIYKPTVVKGFANDPVVVKKDVLFRDDIDPDDIITIDGMEPIKLAKAYGINPDGTTRVQKKRGRKPKVQQNG